ncbi:hypothetical protein [Anatilimnocola floriformis]|uniref:hypothetical protein n=1 Tax=Anatilimnocola floriformis TaxID=2948575 RepID=UPI0020C58118|nr:hypothetical protein [Anatilimnocola floriformis]
MAVLRWGDLKNYRRKIVYTLDSGDELHLHAIDAGDVRRLQGLLKSPDDSLDVIKEILAKAMLDDDGHVTQPSELDVVPIDLLNSIAEYLVTESAKVQKKT